MFYWQRIKQTHQAASLFVIALLLVSCSDTPQEASLFINVDSLVSRQVEFLAANEAKISRMAIVNGLQDESVINKADTAVLNKELNIFRQLHAINKPVNRSSYIVDDGLFDPSSNLTVKAFSSIEGKNLPVRYIRVFYQGSVGKPRKIEALYDVSNSLYQSSRELTMHFQQIRNQTILTSYTIIGGQKMILGDSVKFTIRGEVTIN